MRLGCEAPKVQLLAPTGGWARQAGDSGAGRVAPPCAALPSLPRVGRPPHPQPAPPQAAAALPPRQQQCSNPHMLDPTPAGHGTALHLHPLPAHAQLQHLVPVGHTSAICLEPWHAARQCHCRSQPSCTHPPPPACLPLAQHVLSVFRTQRVSKILFNLCTEDCRATVTLHCENGVLSGAVQLLGCWVGGQAGEQVFESCWVVLQAERVSSRVAPACPACSGRVY